ncbi:uncharacterized protein LOC121380033 [Gigantopelta aegis]|uniref:uncharacterized protein LOC121380033 n=1 Tax=Gigantopelta aegis TaxID=1735272 RepID=UPI001B88DBA4|nr:uncharacterized protein LOC121380033 [Gigantopelta aegis]
MLSFYRGIILQLLCLTRRLLLYISDEIRTVPNFSCSGFNVIWDFPTRCCNCPMCHYSPVHGRKRVRPESEEIDSTAGLESQELKEKAALIVAEVIKTASEHYRGIPRATPEVVPALPTSPIKPRTYTNKNVS